MPRRPKKAPDTTSVDTQRSLVLDADNKAQADALQAAAERVRAAAEKKPKPEAKAAETAGDAQATEVGDSAAPKRRGGGRRKSSKAAESTEAEVKVAETAPAPEPEPVAETPPPPARRSAPPTLQNFVESTRDNPEAVISRVKKSMAQWAPPAPKPDATPAKPLDRLEEDKQLMYGEGVLALRLQKALKGAQKQVQNAPAKVAPEPEPAATPSWMPREVPQRSFPTRTSNYDVTRPVETKEPPKTDPKEQPKKGGETKTEVVVSKGYFKPITGPAASVGWVGKKVGGGALSAADYVARRAPNVVANLATIGTGGALGVSLAGKLARMARQGVRDIKGEPAQEEKKQEGGTEQLPRPPIAPEPVGTPARRLSTDKLKKLEPAVNNSSSILRSLRGKA